MRNVGKYVPPIPVVLASLFLWASFAYGLPDEAAAREAITTAATEDLREVDPAAEVRAAVAEARDDDITSTEVTEPPSTSAQGPAVESAAAPNELTGWFYLGLGYWANSSVNLNYGRYQGVLCATLNDYGTLDVGLLFGYCPFPKLAIAGGVAWVRVGHFYPVYNPIFPGSGRVEYSNTIGVPVEIQFTPIKGRVVGLGLTGHGNFNKDKIFGGATVGIELGTLK